MKIHLRRPPMPDPQAQALQIAAGRLIAASVIIAAPVFSARLLGADTATAQRVTWLTRMMAIRDGALGAGGIAATRRGDSVATWVLGGAVSDAVDAAVLAAALKRGRARGIVPAGIAVGAAGAAVLGVVTAVRVRRS
ncbi:MAG TPA: hypothetical protein VHS54_12260 [Jatrophihabitans sp.]|jgi:hypothetical protein|nr:hypothetical protein [Jatrophihabitans sp.]